MDRWSWSSPRANSPGQKVQYAFRPVQRISVPYLAPFPIQYGAALQEGDSTPRILYRRPRSSELTARAALLCLALRGGDLGLQCQVYLLHLRVTLL